MGGDHLVHLDELREDQAGAELRAVDEVLAPTTAGQLMRRLNARQCQAAVTELARVGEEVDCQLGLTATAPVTLDVDSSDTEVYGRLKEGAAFNHRGQRSYNSQLATWAERRRILASELRSGNLTEPPTAVKVLQRALKALPAEHGQVRARMDSGFESVATFKELRREEVGFTCSLKRTPALHRLRLGIANRAWRPALLMPQAEIAETAHAPQGWCQEPLRLIVRRVRIPVEELSGDPRSRRRRTVPKAQLELAREFMYGYSFVLTDLDGDAAEIELWHRQRGQMEERVRELKLGDGLLHRTAGEVARAAAAASRFAGGRPQHQAGAAMAEVSARPPRSGARGEQSQPLVGAAKVATSGISGYARIDVAWLPAIRSDVLARWGT